MDSKLEALLLQREKNIPIVNEMFKKLLDYKVIEIHYKLDLNSIILVFKKNNIEKYASAKFSNCFAVQDFGIIGYNIGEMYIKHLGVFFQEYLNSIGKEPSFFYEFNFIPSNTSLTHGLRMGFEDISIQLELEKKPLFFIV